MDHKPKGQPLYYHMVPNFRSHPKLCFTNNPHHLLPLYTHSDIDDQNVTCLGSTEKWMMTWYNPGYLVI